MSVATAIAEKTKVILIADDNPFWIKQHESYLRERYPSAEIITCESYQAAKKVIAQRGKELSLIVSDFDMRDKRIDGVLLSRYARDQMGENGPKFMMFSTSMFMKPTVKLLGTNNVQCFRKARMEDPEACRKMLENAYQGLTI